MKLAMCRISNDNGRTWEEVWIRYGTFNIEKKRWARKGYIMKQSIVTKEV